MPYGSNIVDGPGRCREHKRDDWQNANVDRDACGRQRRKIRAAYIAQHPTCQRCGRAPADADATVYTLRHSHASMSHYVSGLTLPDILRRMRHSQQTHFLHYAHIIDAIGARCSTLDELIEAARAVGGVDRKAAQ